MLGKKRILYSRDKEIILGDKTLVMGILNVTPDSFSDGGQFNSIETAVKHAGMMIDEGADIIDIGGESTRPGSKEVAEQEELDRVVPIIKAIREKYDVLISIDTYKAKVADAALLAGADIINDVWGMQKEPEIAEIAVRHNVPLIAMHNQIGTDYTEDIILAMKKFFEKSYEIAFEKGLKRSQIILDPGIGFGKTPEQNVVVMKRLGEMMAWGEPVLLGTSRKSMIGKILDLPADQRLEGTLATNIYGISLGVDIIRIHDVEAHVRGAKVMDAIMRGRIDG
jgi:dihydropteroate synthase